ncbi:unknown [Acidaminococcus sp. CAG:917]|nr:unknown [Acidaminococcus sp. CAG:917]
MINCDTTTAVLLSEWRIWNLGRCFVKKLKIKINSGRANLAEAQYENRAVKTEAIIFTVGKFKILKTESGSGLKYSNGIKPLSKKL